MARTQRSSILAYLAIVSTTTAALVVGCATSTEVDDVDPGSSSDSGTKDARTVDGRASSDEGGDSGSNPQKDSGNDTGGEENDAGTDANDGGSDAGDAGKDGGDAGDAGDAGGDAGKDAGPDGGDAGDAGCTGSTVVIGQVYGGGGNASAPFTNDFVELHNRGNVAVSLAGWSVQYASASGTFQAGLVTALSGSIAPGGYYLVQGASEGAVGAALPTPDAVGNVNMSAKGGKVALVSSTTAIASCNAATVVDLVGFGSASCAETAATPSPSNTTAAIRKGGGCTDTNDNSNDFDIATPTPRNSATAAAVCACAGN
jgi:Lamin Tail Domain